PLRPRAVKLDLRDALGWRIPPDIRTPSLEGRSSAAAGSFLTLPNHQAHKTLQDPDAPGKTESGDEGSEEYDSNREAIRRSRHVVIEQEGKDGGKGSDGRPPNGGHESGPESWMHRERRGSPQPMSSGEWAR